MNASEAQLSRRLAKVGGVVRMIYGEVEHARFTAIALAAEAKGTTFTKLPSDVRDMVIQAEKFVNDRNRSSEAKP